MAAIADAGFSVESLLPGDALCLTYDGEDVGREALALWPISNTVWFFMNEVEKIIKLDIKDLSMSFVHVSLFAVTKAAVHPTTKRHMC